ncbi:lytic transglycosylase domain-containing protein [Ferruginibacter sp.]
MIKRNRSVPGIFAAVLSCICFACVPVVAQVNKDSTKKILLSRLDKKEGSNTVVKAANVVYPDLLCGNEEQSLGYIEKFSASRRAYLIRTYNKGKKFFPKVTAILTKHSLPHEFKILLALESAFNGNAVSKAGAVGYWQIMDEVAREYGLKYAPQLSAAEKKRELKLAKSLAKKGNKKARKVIVRDDRKNFNKSTYTAARYLKDRCRNLDNDYLLVVASYNCGVGNVWQAMKKTGKADPDFWDVKKYLPSETRSYVMNFIALNVIFNNYEKFTNNTLNFKPVKAKADNADINTSEEEGAPTSLNY